jgi:hypothetical protein
MLYVALLQKLFGFPLDSDRMVSVLSMLNGSFCFLITDTTYGIKFNDRFIPNYWVIIGYFSYLSNSEIEGLPAVDVARAKLWD